MIYNCLNLQSVQITEGRLIDAFINNCGGVKNINMSHNNLDKIPDCIFELSNLVEL